MLLTVNNKEVDFAKVTVLQDILSRMNIASTKGIAVAVNNKVIQNSEIAQFSLDENDIILIIQATQGG